MSTISIIGSGSMAAAIGGLAAKAGHSVEISSRDPANARALAKQIGFGAIAKPFAATFGGEIVILAVPYSAVLEVVKQYGDRLAGKILVDITNPVAPDSKSLVTPNDSSGAQEIAKLAPANAIVVKAFNTHFSGVLATGSTADHPLDIFIAGDNVQAKERVANFITSLRLRSFDVGLLPMARTLEYVCLLSIGLMANSIKHTNFSIGITQKEQ